MHDLDVGTRRRKENRIWRYALAVSVLFHVLVLLVSGGRPLPLSPFAAAGPEAGDNRAASGGVQAINVVSPPPRPIERPAIPVPAEINVDPIAIDTDFAFEESSLLGERPGLAEAGTETGDGAGDGGTANEGLQSLQPPKARHMILPPDPPRSLRGVTLRVWVFVDETGKVVSDSTRLDPPTRDRRYNDLLIRETAEWQFRPATKGGLPVAAWHIHHVRLGGGRRSR